jgi:hypothetical protein
MGQLVFNAELHKYTLDGCVLPSVTQVTQLLGGYENIPAEVLERKAKIGTHVHKACELHDAGGVDQSSIDPQCVGYFNAYLKFLDENPCTVLLNEQKLHSERYLFAGTLDRVYRFDHARKGFWMANTPVLVDLKTVATLMASTAVQTAGYRLLLPPLGVPKTQVARVALQLKPNGTYALRPYTSVSDESVFLAALTLHQWRVNHVKPN